jgi:aspartyl-tRNA synthetase
VDEGRGRRQGREGINSPIAKFLDDATLAAIVQRDRRADRRADLLRRGHYKSASDFMGALRLKLGKDLSLVADGWAPLWVTDFPMFEWDDEESAYVALHHPFTAPAVDDSTTCARTRRPRCRAATTWCSTATRSAAVRSASTVRRCSRACSSCSASAPRKRRQVRLPARRAQVGAPPHGGIAFGIDRIAALMAGTESIRDVIAFPKTTTAQCLMTGAPSPIPDAQLAEVHVAVRPKTARPDPKELVNE